jgi:paraquat-inducible protein A
MSRRGLICLAPPAARDSEPLVQPEIFGARAVSVQARALHYTLATSEARLNQDDLCACHACGLVQERPSVSHAAALLCRRCGETLSQVRRRSVALCGVFAALGLLLFLLALAEPVASVVMQGGRFSTTDLLAGPAHLRDAGAWILTVAVVPTLLLVPLLKLTTVAVMAVGVRVGQVPTWVRRLFASLPTLSQWAMLEVFLLGAMIALFRLRDWMLVDYGPALFALSGAALCSISIDVAVDRAEFWRGVPFRRAPQASAGALPIGCHGCDLLVRSHEGARCPRCASPLHSRKPDSIRRTWALLATAAVLAIPANVWPVMTITKLGSGGPSTILGGTRELAEVGLWGLAALVFVASILVPLSKLGALSFLLVSTRAGSPRRLVLRTRLFRVVSLIGRWSMIDIFATMMLAALARFGWLGNVRPEPGASAFCVVVVLTMLASESFDPRLMWDAAGHNPRREPAPFADERAVVTP